MVINTNKNNIHAHHNKTEIAKLIINNTTALCWELPTENFSEHKTLGLTINQHFTWNSHVQSLAKLVIQKVYYLAKIKNVIDEDRRRTYYILYT